MMSFNMRRIPKSILNAIRSLLALLSKITSAPYTLEKGSSIRDVQDFFRLFNPYRTGYNLVRVGSIGDGGYLIPDDLIGIRNCFSPGVGKTCAFENSLAIDYQIKSWLIDDTVTQPEELHPMNNFQSIKLGIDTVVGESVSLNDWVSNNCPEEDSELILQMDIETHEWLSLLNSSIDTLARFRIMVIEFHSLPLVRLPYVLERIYSPVINKLLNQFDILHIHPNNSVGTFAHGKNMYPDTLEVTFHRKDRRKDLIRLTSTRHELDSPCDPNIEELNVDKMFSDPA